MSSNSVNPFYTVFPGTVPYGTVYENRIISLLWLKILNQKNVEDCSMSANDDNYGKLDDVIFNMSYKNKMDQQYLLLLKYEEKGRNVQPDALFGTLSSKKQENKPGDQNKEDFNLSKYINSFVAHGKKFQNSFLILYTNRVFHPRSKSFTFYWKLKNKSVISIPINAVEFRDEDCDINHTIQNIFNTNGNSGSLYQFEMQHFDDSDLTDEEKQCLELFFRRFIFFTSQIDFDGSELELKKLLKYYLGDLKDYEGLYTKYMMFFNDWSKRPKERPKLTENIIKTKIAEFVMSPFIIPFIKPPKYQEKSDFLISAISDFEVTFIRSDFNKFVEEVGYSFVQRCKTDVKEFIIIARKLVILEPKQEIESISDFTHDQLMQILRFKGEVPWAIHVSPSNKKSVQRILTTVFKNSNFAQKYVLLLDENQFDDFTHCQVFKHLGDLQKKSPTKLDTLIDHLSVTVMDKQISLRHLITDKKYPLEFIRVHNVIKLMDNKSFVFGKNSVKVPDFYVNREIIKPVILKTLLGKQCKSLFVVSNPNDYQMQWDDFGKMSVNLDLESEDSYDGDEKLLYTKKKITFEYFNQLKPLSLHNFKVYAFELLSDGNLTCVFTGGLLDFANSYTTPILVKDSEVFKEFTNDITVLVADTGMGKSVLMDYLVQNCPSDYWPLKINVREHYTFFQSNDGNGNDVLEYFLNDDLDEFSNNIRDMYVKENKVFIVWDGLDEFPFEEIDKVIEKIRKVRMIGCLQWITSKRHLSEKLRTEFEVIPVSLSRLSVPEQNSYIRERLKFYYQQSEIDAITTKLHNSVSNYNLNEVLGIPLLLFLFTDVYTNFEAVNIGNSLSLYEIYEHFINGKFKIMTQKKDIDETTANTLLIKDLKRQKDQLHKHYQEAGVLSNFDKDVQQCLNLKDSQFINQILTEGDKNGLIIKVSDDKRAIFLHNTLGDYFAAFHLVNIWETIGIEFRQKILTLLFQEKYQSIKTFFDCLFAKGSEPHKLVLAQQWEQVEKLPTEVLVCTDQGGRSVLHLMCMFDRKYAKVHIEDRNQAYYFWIHLLAPENNQFPPRFQRVFSNIFARTANWDFLDLAGWAPLQYADQNASYYALNTLLSKYPTIEVKQLKSYHPATILFNACVYGYAIHFQKILNDMSNDLLEMRSAGSYNVMYGGHLPSFDERPIHIASKNGYNDVVILLISKGININNSSIYGVSPLYMASEVGHLSVVETLLDNGAHVSVTEQFGRTPLHLASYNGHLNVVHVLIDKGADVSVTDQRGKTPLHLASAKGHLNVVHVLIDKGADVSVTEQFGRTPLHLAFYNDHLNVVHVLIDKGADVSVTDEDGLTPLHWASYNGHLNVVHVLIDKGADVSVTDEDGRTPLHLASDNGHLNVVHVLIDKGADVSVTDEDGHTPLHLASDNGHLNVVHVLIDKGADVSVTDEDGHTPLHLASYNGHSNVVHVLIDKGADVSVTEQFGRTPLHLASDNGHLNVVHVLIDKGADVSVTEQFGRTPLHLASYNGHLNVVHVLIDKGADVSVTDQFGQTPLHFASYNGHLYVVHVLIDKGADVSVTDQFGQTPLHLASYNGHLNIVHVLIDKGADVSVTDQRGKTPLHLASYNGHLNVVHDLIDNGADVSVTDKTGQTPLHLASANGHLDVVHVLIDKGADVSVTDKTGRTPLHLASANGHLNVVHVLIDTGADVSVADKYGQTPLHLVSVNEDLDAVCVLIDKGADVSVTDEDGRTPLHWASYNGHLNIVHVLIDKGADVSVTDEDGRTPLHWASYNGHLNIVHVFIDKGADVSVTDQFGQTPLHFASYNGHLNIVHVLIDKGADVSVTDEGGQTPLHSASAEGAIDVVHVLIDKGADVSVTDKCGQTPLHLASDNGHLNVVHVLIDKGADVSVTDQCGKTPLHLASDKGHLDVVHVLIDKGADVSVIDQRGKTPLHLASDKGHLDVVHVLIDKGADVSVTDQLGRTPLHSASGKGAIDVVHVLIDKGADVSVTDKCGQTPLHLASDNGHLNVVHVLIDKGADVSVIDQRGKTPLHLASDKGHLDVVHVLIDKGADVSETQIHTAKCLYI